MFATDTLIGGRYRLGPLLGRGGMADVYLADDEDRGQPVALKVLRGLEPGDVRRFAEEQRVLSRLDHPAVVRLCDNGDHEGVPFLVLDLVDGLSLAEELKAGPLTPGRVGAVGLAVADGLAHAHGLGVVHRDVKPANILLDQEGNPHLADFGIARLADATALTATGQVVGTASYLAPEQLQGHPAQGPADVYALGLVLLECHTGHRAFLGTPTEAAMARLVRAPDIPGELPGWWRELLGAMTAIDPAARPPASDVADAIDRGSADAIVGPTQELRAVERTRTLEVPVHPAARPSEQTTVFPVEGGRPRSSRRWWLVAALAGAAAVLLVALLVLRLDEGDDPGPSSTTGSEPALPEGLQEPFERLEEAVNP